MTSEQSSSAAHYLCTPPGIFRVNLRLPALPPNVVRETNSETFRRLGHDLSVIDRHELSAVTAHRLYLPNGGSSHSSWGYGLEAARDRATNEILVLFRNDEEDGTERTLRWLPLSTLCTVRQAEVSYQAYYRGPSEEVMRAILHVFHDAFAFAADSNWSYVKRLEFYHSFPFEELSTTEAVYRFRPVLFSCSAFTNSVDIDISPPKCE